jgi:SPP1 family predicted phage head-tail adaptor
MNLGGKTINPGEFRTWITLERRAVTIGNGGFETPTWSTITTCWARWRNAHGNESLQAALQSAEAPATVMIRYVAGLDPTCAVKKGLDRYEILSIDNIEERSEYLELRVKRMKGG